MAFSLHSPTLHPKLFCIRVQPAMMFVKPPHPYCSWKKISNKLKAKANLVTSLQRREFLHDNINRCTKVSWILLCPWCTVRLSLLLAISTEDGIGRWFIKIVLPCHRGDKRYYLSSQNMTSDRGLHSPGENGIIGHSRTRNHYES